MIVFLAKAAATCGFLSYLPAKIFPRPGKGTGAGLVGTFFGLVSLPWLPSRPAQQLFALSGFFLVAVVVCDLAETALGTKDDPRIVLDEWIGYWVTMAFHPWTLLSAMMGFALFRFFDVVKLPFIKRSGELPGGWGVVVDDVLAGLLANAVLQGIGYAFRF